MSTITLEVEALEAALIEAVAQGQSSVVKELGIFIENMSNVSVKDITDWLDYIKKDLNQEE